MRCLLGIVAAVGVVLPASLAAQDIDPVGLYEWEVDAGGQYVYGTFEIKTADEGWTGTASSDEGDMPMRRIEVAGSVISFLVDSPTYGEVYVELEVTGERFTGYATVGGEQVPMIGTKTEG